MRRILFSLVIASIAATAPARALADDREERAAAQQIATILRDSGRMKDYSVGVKYKDGTVWLSGRVSNNQQLQAALGVVSDIEGIDQIVNNMTVARAAKQHAPGAARPGRPAISHMTRRVSATTADFDPAAAATGQELPVASATEGGQVAPAGYNHLARKAARHACPPTMYAPAGGPAVNPPAYDQPYMPNYAWPSYAAYPNYSALTYPQQYSPTAWPYIGPFYPYPQVPLGWRKVALEWDDGWWFLDFYDRSHH